MTTEIRDREKLNTVLSIIRAKRDWLERFSEGRYRRPQHEVDRMRAEVHVLDAIALDYESRLARAGRTEAAP